MSVSRPFSGHSGIFLNIAGNSENMSYLAGYQPEYHIPGNARYPPEIQNVQVANKLAQLTGSKVGGTPRRRTQCLHAYRRLKSLRGIVGGEDIMEQIQYIHWGLGVGGGGMDP